MQQVVQGPDAASSLDLHLLTSLLPHQPEMPNRRALVIIRPVRLLHKSISGRSLDKRNIEICADLTKPSNMVVAQIIILENDF